MPPTPRHRRLRPEALPRLDAMRLQPHRLAAGQRRPVEGHVAGTLSDGRPWKAPWLLEPTGATGWRLLVARPEQEAQAVDLLCDEQGPGRNPRWWFACPTCRHRRGVLFINAGRWACRACHRVAYPSDGQVRPSLARDRDRRFWERRWAVQDAMFGPPTSDDETLRAALRDIWDRWPDVRTVPGPLAADPARDHPLGGDPPPLGPCAPTVQAGDGVATPTTTDAEAGDGVATPTTTDAEAGEDLPVVIVDDSDPATLPLERAALVLAQEGAPYASTVVQRLRAHGHRGRGTRLYALAKAACWAVAEARHAWWRQEAVRRKAPAQALVAVDLLDDCRDALKGDPRWRAVFTALDGVPQTG